MPARKDPNAPEPKPTGGRPSLLNSVVGHRNDGSPITASERIVDAIGVGAYFETAIASCGVSKETAYGWLRIGALTSRAIAAGKRRKAFTKHELSCKVFSDGVAEAESKWELTGLSALERLGRGGLKVEVVTEKRDAQDNVLERTVRTETLAPSAQVLEWRLTRRFPERYSQRVELSGPNGGPIELSREERANTLADQAEAYLHGHDDAQPEPSTNGATPSTNGKR